ncbi:MAG: type II toxin-antitoxin system RelE/ParE family toxin [bacterium]|nr:type II toxin-antitoxin system RelE/ParE family toxin [bacterium]
MRVRYTEEAISDVEEILSYIALRNPVAAGIVSEVIELTIARAASFPYSAQATDETSVRMIPVGRFPYLIFYSVVRNTVWVLRVRHAARLRP